VHQQLAHERILFEKYLEDIHTQSNYSQKLLFPEILELNTADYNLMAEILSDILNLGFDLEPFGKNAFMINGTPADMQEPGKKEFLEHIIEDYKNTAGADSYSKHEKLALAFAKNTPIKIGRPLAYNEMTRLIDELFACKTPYFSPEGRPALITISSDELDKKFRK